MYFYSNVIGWHKQMTHLTHFYSHLSDLICSLFLCCQCLFPTLGCILLAESILCHCGFSQKITTKTKMENSRQYMLWWECFSWHYMSPESILVAYELVWCHHNESESWLSRAAAHIGPVLGSSELLAILKHFVGNSTTFHIRIVIQVVTLLLIVIIFE